MNDIQDDLDRSRGQRPGDRQSRRGTPRAGHAHWRRLDERIEGLSREIEAMARRDVGCERLMSVPGIGPIIATATVAAIGNLLQRPLFRCLAGARPQANLDARPHHPRQHIETRKSLPPRSVRSGGLGRIDQAKELRALRAQVLARGGEKAAAP
jgi:transposase